MLTLAIDIETLPDLESEVLELLRSKLEAPSNYKDPAAILRWKAEAEEKLVDRAALSPLTGRIVALGYCWVPQGVESITVDTAPTPEGELGLLQRFAEALLEAAPLEDDRLQWTTFNGRTFDLPFLAARCAHLGVSLPARLPLGADKYRRHRDVYEDVLKHFGGTLGAWGARIARKAAHGDGAQVAQWVVEGRWDELVLHCRRDVEILVDLYSRFSEVMT